MVPFGYNSTSTTVISNRVYYWSVGNTTFEMSSCTVSNCTATCDMCSMYPQHEYVVNSNTSHTEFEKLDLSKIKIPFFPPNPIQKETLRPKQVRLQRYELSWLRYKGKPFYSQTKRRSRIQKCNHDYTFSGGNK
jgi:hypothetical protein